MVEKGQILKAKTKTKNDVFGTCWWEVIEVGMDAPEKPRRAAGIKDGVKCILLGGTGPSARPGLLVHDSQMKIAADIAEGITEIVPRESVPVRGQTRMVNKDGSIENRPRPNTGCVEV